MCSAEEFPATVNCEAAVCRDLEGSVVEEGCGENWADGLRHCAVTARVACQPR